MTVLNLIVAEQLQQFYKQVTKEIDKGTEKKIAIVNILRDYIKHSKKIRFEGDNYSEDWIKEAAQRGLSNIIDTPGALEHYVSEKTVTLYEKHNILAKQELRARNDIRLENYILKIQIESRVMGDLVLNHIIPTAINYQNKLIANSEGLKVLGIDNTERVRNVERISHHIEIISKSVNDMIEERRKINQIEDLNNKAREYCDKIRNKYFDQIRNSVDQLELLVDDNDWPLVKYREMLFLR